MIQIFMCISRLRCLRIENGSFAFTRRNEEADENCEAEAERTDSRHGDGTNQQGKRRGIDLTYMTQEIPNNLVHLGDMKHQMHVATTWLLELDDGS